MPPSPGAACWLPVRAVKSGALAGGGPLPLSSPAPRDVLDPAVSLVLADILSDDRARAAAFGRGGALDLPFPVAAKTGTSKGFRDNIAVGFTREVTVAVWAGNFDGSPMEGVSGVSGAGPLFHGAMLAAQALYPAASRAPLREQLALSPAGTPARGQPGSTLAGPPVLETAEVCPLSGERRGPDCPHAHTEVFPATGASRAPNSTCRMHVRLRADRRNGLRAGASCPAAHTEERLFERHTSDLAAWAKTARRPLAPTAYSPLCPPAPGEAEPDEAGGLRLAYPCRRAPPSCGTRTSPHASPSCSAPRGRRLAPSCSRSTAARSTRGPATSPWSGPSSRAGTRSGSSPATGAAMCPGSSSHPSDLLPAARNGVLAPPCSE